MRAEHLEILVEEPSMEAFLVEFLPRLIGNRSTFAIHPHQGKPDLLNKLEFRLRGYAHWLPDNIRIIVVVDRDDDDCSELKRRLEQIAQAVGLSSRGRSSGNEWRIVNRIAIEELEAWFFGEWNGVRLAYPDVARNVPSKAAYRNCDAIAGGTSEALERIFKRAGYFPEGLRKVEAAREIGKHLNHTICQSPSFIAFRDALVEATS